ncbi:unnamed protein product [Cuscuta epithymum]|uniref:GAG-pre-integrase domain-containing protein n=1 Tax=Cuscuta epithymum TaxID=186058 RepID=A0AAV0ERP9_9ASTE|nr:unnamed protein product [Cuscuta epithymum]
MLQMLFHMAESANICVIQDRHSKKLIGAGEQENGLYYLRASATIQSVHTDLLSGDFWHKRLGHPSSQVMKKLSFMSGIEEEEEEEEMVFFLNGLREQQQPTGKMRSRAAAEKKQMVEMLRR